MIPRLPKGFTHPMAIGEGVFSSVYRVRQDSLDRWVAVKILKEKDRKKRAEQIKEARTQANMQVGCVPEVFDVFEWNKQVVIVMQWVKGIRLSALFKAGLNQEQRFWLAEGILQAAATLHSHGYAHRDLKPDNILVSPKDGIFLVDFGLSKEVNEVMKTAVGVAKGTPAYMAPELWLGMEHVDYFRADIYAVGKILKAVLQDCPAGDYMKSLLQEEPSKRPANGTDALQLWNSQSGFSRSSPVWELVAGEAASGLHARNLYNAAKSLKHVGREDEAYWLLSECLEENPNDNEALTLMSRFSEDGKIKSRRRRLTTALVSVLVIFLVLAFLLGRQKGKQETKVVLPGSYQQKKKSMLLSPPVLRREVDELLPLRVDSATAQSLCGRLMVLDVPDKGQLSANDRALEIATSGEGWQVSHGWHVLTWRNPKGEIRWREKIKILPFQTKVIRFPLQPAAVKG